MGRLIDADEVKKRYPIMENDFGMVINERLHKELDKIPTVEAIPKSDYETRLKADMVAMLEELDLQIDEISIPKALIPEHIAWNYGAEAMKDEIKILVQQKINSLEEA